MAKPGHAAWVALGSNLGDSWAELMAAWDALTRLPDTTVEDCSAVYRSAPWGVRPQPDFLNAACRLRTLLTPRALLEALLEIEQARGRVRESVGAPRTLDLDLLLYDTLVLQDAHLVLPHPRMHLRRFVLQPLADMDPSLAVPGHGTILELLTHCPGPDLERWGPSPIARHGALHP